MASYLTVSISSWPLAIFIFSLILLQTIIHLISQDDEMINFDVLCLQLMDFYDLKRIESQ